MHILFLTDNFPPEVNAPANRTFEHCQEWVAAGHKVTVVTCTPNYPKGKVFEGYKNRLWQSEEISGIRVVRVWTFISANEKFLKRIIDYISFMVSASVLAPFLVKKPDIVIGTSPQFFTACAAYLVSRIKRVPYIFELRDLWPESIHVMGVMKKNWLLDGIEKLEMFLYRKARLIVTVTHSFRANLEARGIDRDKIKVVTNGVDVAKFFPHPKDQQLLQKHDLVDKFVVGYVGTHGLTQALETILDAAEKLKNDENGDLFRFIFLGDGAVKKDLKAKAAKLELDNVIFVDTVPRSEVLRYWSILDASIIHLRNIEIFRAFIPSKLFECMSMGIPVLHGVEGESADIVRKANAGLVFESENVDALCTAIKRLQSDKPLLSEFRKNGPATAKLYDRRKLARDMLAHLEDLHEKTQ